MEIDALLKRIEKREFKVGIIGLGYVGLPLMWTFHQKNMPVIGYDIDESKVNCINRGISYIKHLGEEKMKVLAQSDFFDATSVF